jgi:hypothetical protein
MSPSEDRLVDEAIDRLDRFSRVLARERLKVRVLLLINITLLAALVGVLVGLYQAAKYGRIIGVMSHSYLVTLPPDLPSGDGYVLRIDDRNNARWVKPDSSTHGAAPAAAPSLER